MPRTRQPKRSRTLPGVTRVAAVVVICVVTLSVAAAAVSAHSTEPSPPPQWPRFSDALDERESQRAMAIHAAAEPPTHSVLTSDAAVSAPLPQAVVTGLFLLGGNWVLTRMWKQRKI